MIPEVLPLSVRGTAMGVAVFLNWGANFLVSQMFPPLLNVCRPRSGVHWLYGGLGILAALFVKRDRLPRPRAAVWRRSRQTCRGPASVGAASTAHHSGPRSPR